MIKSLASTSSLIPPYQLPSNYNVSPVRDLITFEERLRQNLDNIHRLQVRLYLRLVGIILCTIFIILLHRHLANPTWTLLVFYLMLLGLAITAFTTWRTWWNSSASQYRRQCQKTLHIFNLQLIKDEQHGGQCLSFLRRVPGKLAEFVDEYRAEFRARRALRPMQPPTAARKTTILKLD